MVKFFKAPEDIYTKMRAGDFEMEDFEVDGKSIKTLLSPMKIFIKIMKMLKSVKKKPFVLFSAGLRKHQNAISAYLL